MDEPREDVPPPSVYWRRRTLAVVGTSAAVLLFIWAAGALIGGNSARQTNNAADEGAVPLTPTSAPPRSNPPPISRLPASSSTSSSTTSATPSPTSVLPPPGPPKACATAAIALAATVDKPSYQVGQRPVFTLHIRNAGTVACVSDVSRPLRNLIVLPAGAPPTAPPLWSDTDCYAVPSHDVLTLQPGQEITYTLAWAGRTSAPGCPVHRTTVAPGQYAVVAKLGPLSSAPTPFTLTP